MMKSSRIRIASVISALLIGGQMIPSASAIENAVGWKTTNPGRNDVFDVYDATRSELPDLSGTVDWKTSNPNRTEVFDAYSATRTEDPDATGIVRIQTTNAHRNDVYDIYSK
ncbi:MAG: hypothetical protein PVH25_14540 [Burkholderiales bacterium]|jgi:hypothetical protein